MSNLKKIDDYFVPQLELNLPVKQKKPLRLKVIKFIKLALPALAALLIGMLIIMPQLKKNINDITTEAITPNKGELEKFHMENGIFYITDYKNIVNNFHADVLDETEPGSKIIQMTNPHGKLPTMENNEVQIKSPLGFYDQNTKLLHLEKGVELDYSAGITAQTEEMFFDFNTGQAYGVKPILTKSDTAIINAEGFRYYKDKNILIYNGKNHTILNVDNVEGGI